jgi:hypothetical protein
MWRSNAGSWTRVQVNGRAHRGVCLILYCGCELCTPCHPLARADCFGAQGIKASIASAEWSPFVANRYAQVIVLGRLMEAFLFMIVGPLAVSLAFVLYMSQTERWLQELFFEGIDLVGFLVMYSAFNGRSVQELPRLSSLVDRSCAPTAQRANLEARLV